LICLLEQSDRKVEKKANDELQIYHQQVSLDFEEERQACASLPNSIGN